MGNTINRPTIEDINNVLAGLATKEVAKRVAEWFTTHEGTEFVANHMQHDIDNILEDMEDIYVNQNIPSSAMLDKINQKIERKRNMRIMYRVAAAFIPIAFISAIATYFVSSPLQYDLEYTDIYIAKGEQRNIELSDGTVVALNSDTHFSYPKEFKGKQREVFLDGEAYFEVESDKSNPFIISLDNSKVRVTGTRFNVDAYKSDRDIVVSLYEGVVSFDLSDGQTCNLDPGQTLSYIKAANSYSLCNNISMNEPAWKNHDLIFDHTSFAEIVKTLERSYDVKFIIKSPQFIDHTYSMTLKNPSLESVLYDLGKISPMYFEYNISDKTVTVTVKY